MQEIRLASGATEADIRQALANAGTNTTIILPEGETIAISTGLVVDVTSRNITLDLNGATLQQAGAVSVVQAKGTQSTARTVQLGTDADGNTTITYAQLPAEVKVGGWMKVVSDDALPFDKLVGPAPTLMGQHLEVASVSGNTVTFKGALLDQAVYQTNVRAAAYKSGEFTLKNGEVVGDGIVRALTPPLVEMRDIAGAKIEGIKVHDGVGYGISVVNAVNTAITDISVVNQLDGPSIQGIGIHSMSSTGTAIKGYYAENVTHAADSNSVGGRLNWPYIAQYGADIGMGVTDAVAYGTRNFAYSWHSESVNSSFENILAFDSHGFLMARGVDNFANNGGGAGNERGVVFYEFGHRDASGISVDHIFLKETVYYGAISILAPHDNVLKNSNIESYGAGNNAKPEHVTVQDTVFVRADQAHPDDVITGTARGEFLLGGLGNDRIDGADGDDYIWGGAGFDVLRGGAGRDRFVFHQMSEAGDVIEDFQAGAAGDVIDLSVLAARLNWRDGDVVQHGYARFVQDGSSVRVEIDADGGADGFVTLATLLNIDASLLTHANLHTALWGFSTTGNQPAPVQPQPDPEPEPEPEVQDPAPPVPPTPPAPPVLEDGINFNYPPNAAASVYGDHLDNRMIGTAANNVLYGQAGHDRLDGHGGDDMLIGGDGYDQLYGGDGNDFLCGGRGGDWLHGGAGYDAVTYVESDIAVIANLADDTKNAGGAAGDRYISIENLVGSRFGDVLIGSAGNNVIDGGDGNDQLNGGAGADWLAGAGGDDWINGGAWKDVLLGGAGRDGFYFANVKDAGDTIMDFTRGEDTIYLSAAGFGLKGDHHVNFQSHAKVLLYQGNAAYAGTTDPTLLYDQGTGRLLFDADGTGKQATQLVAILNGKPNITFDDFDII